MIHVKHFDGIYHLVIHVKQQSWFSKGPKLDKTTSIIKHRSRDALQGALDIKDKP